MPYCHFELEDSDYIRNARRNPELRGPMGAPAGTTLDPATRVIEYSTIGIGVKHRCCFNIVNPTNSNYSFQWINQDETNLKREVQFHCLTPEGSITAGKKAEVKGNWGKVNWNKWYKMLDQFYPQCTVHLLTYTVVLYFVTTWELKYFWIKITSQKYQNIILCMHRCCFFWSKLYC